MTKNAPARHRVLHLAVEYPSRNRLTNTPAVRNFIRANPLVDYRVIALRRTANPFKCNALAGDDLGDPKVTSMMYWGLPFGLLLFLSMTIVAWRIRRMVEHEGIDISLIHAHKFSFEGIAGWWLSRWLKIPLALSVRGEAEQKVLKYKPHYLPFFRRQLRDVTRIYYVSAWFKKQMNDHFSIDPEKESLLPNFVAEHQWQPSKHFRTDHLASIMDLNVHKKKGLTDLLQAIQIVKSKFPTLKLDIFGGGYDDSVAAAQALINQYELEGTVRLVGKTDNSTLLQALPNYAGMALTSHNETFGMAYVESLLSGIPILYSNETGIDGFLTDIEACIGAEPGNVGSIATAMETLLQHQHSWRQWLQDNHRNVMVRFQRENYIADYNRTFKLLPLAPTSPAHIANNG